MEINDGNFLRDFDWVNRPILPFSHYYLVNLPEINFKDLFDLIVCLDIFFF